MAGSLPAGSAPLESAAEAAARTLGIDKLHVFILGGVPHMEGTVPTFRHKRAAAELVGLLTGGRQVVNRLRVAPGELRSDRTIAQLVRAALEEAPEVTAVTIQPEVRNGVVELRGTVQSLAARCVAGQAAWSVGGVANVVNRLRVAGIAVSADDLARQLKADLCACLGLPPAAVTVKLQEDTVHLEGTVPSSYHRLAVEDLVRAHEMVQDVVNTLAVSQIMEPAPGLAAEAPSQVRAS